MTSNASQLREVALLNSSSSCGHNLSAWEHHMEKMYSYFYLLLFIPGLVLNSIALWVLCRYTSKKTKAVIFMINLALADLTHILSLPLRIFYYFTHTWPFGQSVCLFCFYLKYLNMYAAIVFLVCISVQRCVFLLHPFSARKWRRRYDLMISLTVWVLVSLACSPFILMRRGSASNASLNMADRQQRIYNTSVFPWDPSTHGPAGTTKLYPPPLSSSLVTLTPTPGPHSAKAGCFKDLPMRRLPLSMAVTMMALAELFGFFIPLACIMYSSARITYSLNKKKTEGEQHSTARSRLQSVTSGSEAEKVQEKQTNGEKQRALRMVLSCCAVFMLCFAPYHINFMLYLMVSQGILTHCGTQLVVRQFHPVSLCLASLSCCLNPLLYYFLTAEFRLHLKRRASSFSQPYSPFGSPTQRLPLHRLTSEESTCSDRT